jgi:hypothetical protein
VKVLIVPLPKLGTEGSRSSLVTYANRATADVTAFTMISDVDPLIPPDEAMMEGRPGAAALASPELLIDAEVASEEVHVTVEVMSAMLPSLKAPAAANCCVAPAAMVVLVGVTAMDFNVAVGVTGGGEDSDPQEYKVPAAMLHNNSTNLRSVPPGRLYRGVSRKPTPLRVIFARISLPSAAFAVTG